jgi:tetratricopeptide (TPR) repeat protein
VSAVFAPKPDEAPEPAGDADGWALLEGLRRRIDDQAALGRKTAAQVTQLAESIAGLVAQQRRRSLWLNVNSFAAYLMFTILCAAGCYLLYQSRARELAAARDQVVGERDAAVRRADDQTARLVARDAADARAWEIYQLLEAGKRGDAVAKLDALRDQPLSKTERAVLAARVHDTQVMEVDAALKAAIAAFKAGRPGDVVKPLEAALSVEPAGARAATIHYYLGVAYARTELDKAAAHLQAAVAGDVEQEDARFQLASVLDRSGAYGQARAEYDRFATAHPQSQLAVFAMRRSATLARLPAVVPPPAGAAPAVPGGASPVNPAGSLAPTIQPGQLPGAANPVNPGTLPVVPGRAPGVAPNGPVRLAPGLAPAGAAAPAGPIAPAVPGRPGAPALNVPARPATGLAPTGSGVAPRGIAPGGPGIAAPAWGKAGMVPRPAVPGAPIAPPRPVGAPGSGSSATSAAPIAAPRPAVAPGAGPSATSATSAAPIAAPRPAVAPGSGPSAAPIAAPRPGVAPGSGPSATSAGPSAATSAVPPVTKPSATSPAKPAAPPSAPAAAAGDPPPAGP